VEVIETSELGDRGYATHGGPVAVASGPRRDVDGLERVLAELGTRREMVLETHIHSDDVSGGLELARCRGPRYAVSVSFAVLTEARRREGAWRGAWARRAMRAPGSIASSTHVPTYSILDHLDERPPGQLWAHCASG